LTTITLGDIQTTNWLSGTHLESYKGELLQPNRSSVWILGEDQIISWNTSTIYGGYVRIFLQTSTAVSSLYTITAEAENTGNYTWSDIDFESDISTKEIFCGWPDTFIMRIVLSLFYENRVINFLSQQFMGIKPIHFTNLMNGALWVSHQVYNVTWDHSLSASLMNKSDDEELILQIVYLVAFNPSYPIGAYDWYPLVDLLEVNANDRVAEITVPHLEKGAIYGLKLYHPERENSVFAITSLDYPIRICGSEPSAIIKPHHFPLWPQGVQQDISFTFDLQNKGYIFLTAIEINNNDAEYIELNCGRAVSDCSEPNCTHAFSWLTTQSLTPNANYSIDAWWMPSNMLDVDATGYRVQREVTITPGAFFEFEEHFGSYSSYERIAIFYTTTFSSLSTIWVALVKNEELYQIQEFPNDGNFSLQIGRDIPSGEYNLRLWVYPCGDDVSDGIYGDASQVLFISNTTGHYYNKLITGMIISLIFLSVISFILFIVIKCKRKSLGKAPRTIMGKVVPKIGRDYATFKEQRMNKFGFNDIFDSQASSAEEQKHDLNPNRNPWRRIPENKR